MELVLMVFEVLVNVHAPQVQTGTLKLIAVNAILDTTDLTVSHPAP